MRQEYGLTCCRIDTCVLNFLLLLVLIKIARITSALAVASAFCYMIFSWCGLCCGCLIRPIRIVLGVLVLISAPLVGCIFLINKSETCTVNTNCSFSLGGGLAIGAILSYVVASVLFCAAKDQGDDEDGEKRGEVLPQATATATAAGPAVGTVTVEKVEMPDGTVVTKTTTVNADGSHTVEETTETPAPAAADEEVPMHEAKVY